MSVGPSFRRSTRYSRRYYQPRVVRVRTGPGLIQSTLSSGTFWGVVGILLVVGLIVEVVVAIWPVLLILAMVAAVLVAIHWPRGRSRRG